MSASEKPVRELSLDSEATLRQIEVALRDFIQRTPACARTGSMCLRDVGPNKKERTI